MNQLHPWGFAAYILDTSNKFGKLGPRWKKCIFIRYSENSKGYIFIKDFDERVTKIEFQDIIFLENQFPKKNDMDKDSHLYEMDEQGMVGTS